MARSGCSTRCRGAGSPGSPRSRPRRRRRPARSRASSCHSASELCSPGTISVRTPSSPPFGAPAASPDRPDRRLLAATVAVVPRASLLWKPWPALTKYSVLLHGPKTSDSLGETMLSFACRCSRRCARHVEVERSARRPATVRNQGCPLRRVLGVQGRRWSRAPRLSCVVAARSRARPWRRGRPDRCGRGAAWRPSVLIVSTAPKRTCPGTTRRQPETCAVRPARTGRR